MLSSQGGDAALLPIPTWGHRPGLNFRFSTLFYYYYYYLFIDAFFFVPTLLLPGQLIDSVILPCSLLGATQLNNNHQSCIWTMSKCGRQSEERRKNPRNQRVDKNKKEMALSLMVWLRLWQVGRPFIFSTSAG